MNKSDFNIKKSVPIFHRKLFFRNDKISHNLAMGKFY